MTGIRAFYFDGKTSRKHVVELTVHEGIASISGDAEAHWPLSDLRVSERVRNGARKVTFPNDSYLEIVDHAAFGELLAATGHQDSFVVRMQQSWRATLVALMATLGILTLAYLYALPAASNIIAKTLPEKIERSIGRETLGMLDKRMLQPSQLPKEQREAIVQHFSRLTPPRLGAPKYEIIFRKSQIGPNAFALPSGHIILTDEIVQLVQDDDAVMGILAHELGHLHERHLMRRIIQGSAIAAVTTALLGDVSTVVANIPTLLLDMKYSRDAEREADDYAIALFKANGISLSNLAHVFEKLGEKSREHSPYLSSHPPTSERIERIRASH